MSEREKPLGWRPFTDEYRASLATLGMPEAEIAALEAKNKLVVNEDAIVAFEMAAAILEAAATRLGPDFVRDVRNHLSSSAARAASGTTPEDEVTAPIISDMLDLSVWKRLAPD